MPDGRKSVVLRGVGSGYVSQGRSSGSGGSEGRVRPGAWRVENQMDVLSDWADRKSREKWDSVGGKLRGNRDHREGDSNTRGRDPSPGQGWDPRPRVQ